MNTNGIQNLVTGLRKRNSGGKRVKGAEKQAKEPEKQAKEPEKRERAPRQSGKKKRRQVSVATRWRRLSWIERLILLTPVAAAIVAVVAINLFFNRELMSYELKGKPCQYYAGSVYRMEEGATLMRTSEGKTMIKDSSGRRAANGLPIYYEDRNMLTIPQDMVYYAPRSGTNGRLGYFSEVYQYANGRIEIQRNGEELKLESGFLYDGEDLYIFLEPVILTFNGYEMNLPPLSYVEAVYTENIMVFNYDGKNFFMEAPKGPVTARIETGDYEVSLLGDSMTDYSGKRTLLFGRPELLEPVG